MGSKGDKERGKLGVRARLAAAITDLRQVNRLLRYVLASVLIAGALFFTIGKTAAGDVVSLSSLTGGLPLIGNSNEDRSMRIRGPILKLEFRVQQRQCPMR